MDTFNKPLNNNYNRKSILSSAPSHSNARYDYNNSASSSFKSSIQRKISFNDHLTTDNNNSMTLNNSTNDTNNNNQNMKSLNRNANNNNNNVDNYFNKTSDSSSSSSSKVQPIWKSLIYDPNTSIYIIKTEKVESFLDAKQHVPIADATNCNIYVYTNGDVNGTVYFTVNGTYEARCDALERLRDETNRAGVIVNLPSSLNSVESNNDDSNNKWKTSSSNGKLIRNANNSTTSTTVKKTNVNNRSTIVSFSNTPDIIDYNDNNNDNTKTTLNKSKTSTSNSRTITRTKSFGNNYDLHNSNNSESFFNKTISASTNLKPVINNNDNSYLNRISNSSTSSSISSSSSSSKSTGSDVVCSSSGFKMESSISLNNFQLVYNNEASNVKSTSNNPTSSPRRYKFEFLLKQADSAKSKEVPKQWPELNSKYPNICFNGRVISYFNPQKYEAYWNKIKQMNQDIHMA